MLTPRPLLPCLLGLVALLGCSGKPPEGGEKKVPSIAARTAALQKKDGYLPVYWDPVAGKLFLEVPRPGEEMIHYSSLSHGLGSNDIGLDRGQLGETKIVRFDRIGPKVLLVQPNLGFRANSENPAERRAVEESFATSVLWGFKVEAETDGRVLVDATDFIVRDAHGIAEAIKRAKQGEMKLEPSRSAVLPERSKAFPTNTELEATLTFVGDSPGQYLQDVTPTPEAVTVGQRLSFVKLPPPGFVPRRFDPGAGFIPLTYVDMAVPIAEPVTRRFILRHRLQKKDPSAAVSEPVQPIVYYLDPGTPEPIRTALLDGARWWAGAFEAAGFRNAFRVELLPDGADPLDARYNVIQWVHRATRGWSYGTAVIDPRTGEIIKGHVTLGSLRVRQDLLLAEGLLLPYSRGDERPTAAETLALDRLRQLSAHEVGHSLGLMHNYVSSTQGRASVMDYPHPLILLEPDGRLNVAKAYAADIGDWDRVAIHWGYTEIPQGQDERATLDRILAEARGRGLTFFTDEDARPTGSSHPQAHLWDNGDDAAAELDRMLRVRKVALAAFGERAIRAGAPLAKLEEALVPLYFHHRYQVEAATKVIGGLSYAYALRGDGQVPVTAIPPATQRRALASVLHVLTPEVLMLPPQVLRTLPPRPSGFAATRELFTGDTGRVLDALAPATAAADMVVGLVLDPDRATRLIQQHALDAAQPSLLEVIGRMTDLAFGGRARDGYAAEVGRTVERSVVYGMLRLGSTARGLQVRAEVGQALTELRGRLERTDPGADRAERANRTMLAGEIRRWLDRRWDTEVVPKPVTPPPGSPIGLDDEPGAGR